MKKILIIAMILAFMAACSGPPEHSQKESTKKSVKAAKQYDPWPKHQKSTTKPLTFKDLEKPREELEKDLEKVRKENRAKIKQFAGQKQ